MFLEKLSVVLSLKPGRTEGDQEGDFNETVRRFSIGSKGTRRKLSTNDCITLTIKKIG